MSWREKKTRNRETSFAELAPKGLCDLHAHILPGLDDGAEDIAESLAMLKGMSDLGYTLIVATPHFNSVKKSPGENEQKLLIEEINRQGEASSLKILPGAEIVFDDVFLAEEKDGGIPRIGCERTYLVEFGFSPGSVPPGIEDVLFRFRAKGGNIIVAHPERIPDFQNNVGKLERIRRQGALLQVDLTSLCGRHGAEAERMAKKLIEENCTDIVASDIHRLADLAGISRALEELAKQDEVSFVRLASTNPLLIATGRFDEVEQDG